MLEIRVNQCMSACQCSGGSSPELSADLSSIETNWQACRVCVIAKVPVSPCRGNSLRERRCTSTQETWLSLWYCMWQPLSSALGHSAQSAPRLLQGTQEKALSWCFKCLCSLSEVLGSHKSSERLRAFLYYDASMFTIVWVAPSLTGVNIQVPHHWLQMESYGEVSASFCSFQQCQPLCVRMLLEKRSWRYQLVRRR